MQISPKLFKRGYWNIVQSLGAEKLFLEVKYYQNRFGNKLSLEEHRLWGQKLLSSVGEKGGNPDYLQKRTTFSFGIKMPFMYRLSTVFTMLKALYSDMNIPRADKQTLNI